MDIVADMFSLIFRTLLYDFMHFLPLLVVGMLLASVRLSSSCLYFSCDWGRDGGCTVCLFQTPV